MAIGNRITIALPSLPNNELNPILYAELSIIYRAIRNLLDGVSKLTGIDSTAQEEWALTPESSTILTGNATKMYPVASELVSIGQLVNLFDNAGTLGARLASANSATTVAHGIAASPAGPGGRFEMQYLRSYVASIGGMVPGTLYYLSTTAGAIQNLPPLAAGTIQQPVGVAVTSSGLLLDISLSFKLN
jgi:hypothetical protein